MAIESPITRRGLLVGAAATAVLATTRASAKHTRRDDEMTRLSIAEASRRIAAGELSPVELTRAYLARIESVDRRVNSYITVTADRALEQARTLEAELVRGGPRSPLHGIPIALKDNIDTAGILTTAASAVYADRVPTEDAECVRKLRDCRRGVPRQAEHARVRVRRHVAPSRTTGPCTIHGISTTPPGGSSGGSAAAVAARLCAAALGTDTAASVRFPAGVLRSRRVEGDARPREHPRHRAAVGDRTITSGHSRAASRTAALVMNALAGFDRAGPGEHPHRAAGLARRRWVREVSRLRIGIPRSPFFENLDPEIEAATESRNRHVEGHRRGGLTEVVLPPVDSLRACSMPRSTNTTRRCVADPVRRALYQPQTIRRIIGGANVAVKRVPRGAIGACHRAQHRGRAVRECRRAACSDCDADAGHRRCGARRAS